MVKSTLLLVTKMLTYGDISEVATDNSSLSFHRRADFSKDSTQYYISKRTAHKHKYNWKKGFSFAVHIYWALDMYHEVNSLFT